MTVIGLTGKTGAGKSTVSLELEKNGCYIIDGDVIAREIVSKGSPAIIKLAEEFGEDILNDDKTLNRKALARKAFSSEENRQKLNAITHPFITEKMIEKINFAKENGYEFSVIDAAALLESECKKLCDFIAVIHADENVRLERILNRDKISVDDAKIRMKSQKPDEYYFENADIIIMNDLRESVEDLAKKILNFNRR